MGSMTQSLLESSADKTAQDAANLKKQTAPSDHRSGKDLGDSAEKLANNIKSKPAAPATPSSAPSTPPSYKKGGTIPKTGIYKLHEGEEVIPAKRASEYRKVYLGRKSKKD